LALAYPQIRVVTAFSEGRIICNFDQKIKSPFFQKGKSEKKFFDPLIKLTFSTMITRLKVFKPLFKALDLLFRFIFSSMFIRVNVFKPFKHFRSSEKLLAPGKVSASKRL
jgi:hypothetical protein